MMFFKKRKSTPKDLWTAIQKDDMDGVKKCLKDGVDLHAQTPKDKYENTILQNLIIDAGQSKEKFEILKTVLDSGAELFPDDVDCATSLINDPYSEKRFDLVLDTYLKQGGGLNVTCTTGETLLQSCINLNIRPKIHSEDNNKQLNKFVKRLLKKGANPNLGGNDYFPLHAACKDGNIELVDMLLAHGADVLAKDNIDRTAFSEIYDSIYLSDKEKVALSDKLKVALKNQVKELNQFTEQITRKPEKETQVKPTRPAERIPGIWTEEELRAHREKIDAATKHWKDRKPKEPQEPIESPVKRTENRHARYERTGDDRGLNITISGMLRKNDR